MIDSYNPRVRALALSAILLLLVACASEHAQSPPPKPAPPPLEFLGEWGTRGEGPGQLSSPTGIAVDAVGNVYVSDGGSRFVHKFTAEGHPLQSFQDPFFKEPVGIALDRGDAIYVSDCKQHAIQVFLPTAESFLVIRGGTAHRLVCPAELVVGADGFVFVQDNYGHRIQKFDARGKWLRSWGEKDTAAEESAPFEGLALGADGILYVLDDSNKRVQKFNGEGELLSQWEISPLLGVPRQENWFSGIAVSHNSVFLANSRRRTIDVWTLDGQHKLETNVGSHLASDGSGPLYPAISPRGELLVLDAFGSRVLRFRINF
jgi:tripartite motif-containing protein 71